MSWLDLVPVCRHVYVFQDALLCEDCGRTIIRSMKDNGIADEGDSNDYPQGPYTDGGGESDVAHFCGNHSRCMNAVEVTPGHKIGCPLGNPLTNEGAEDLRETIRKDVNNPQKQIRKIGRLLHHVWKAYVETPLLRLPYRYEAEPPLSKALVNLTRDEKCEVAREKYTDLEYVYGIASNPYKTLVWRIELTDEGGFTGLSVVKLPASEAMSRPTETMILEAISEGAWD